MIKEKTTLDVRMRYIDMIELVKREKQTRLDDFKRIYKMYYPY